MKRVDPSDLTVDDLDALVDGFDQLIDPDAARPDQEVPA